MLSGGGQRKKNWDNCNSIINKIQLRTEIAKERKNRLKTFEEAQKDAVFMREKR